MARNSKPALAVIFGIVFIDLVGFGIVIPVLPLYAERFGASPFIVGCLLSIYSLMQAICAPLLGRLSDRVGRKPVLLISLLGTSAGFALMGAAKTLPLLFVARILDGVTGGNISTAQAYIADVTPPEQRSKGMGLIGAAFGLGFIFGPAIGGLLGHFSLAAPFFFAAALAFANALAVWRWLPESLAPEQRGLARRRSALGEVLGQAKTGRFSLILAAYFCSTAAFSLLTATYPLFTERRFGFGVAHNGYIFAAQGLIGACIQGLLLGRLLHLFRDKTLAVAGTAVLAASLFLLPASQTIPVLLLVTAGVAIGHSLLAAPLNGLASKAVGPTLQGRVLGLMQSAASLARIVGPVLGGWLLSYDAARLAPPFIGRSPYWAGGLTMVLSWAFTLAL